MVPGSGGLRWYRVVIVLGGTGQWGSEVVLGSGGLGWSSCEYSLMILFCAHLGISVFCD